MEKQTIDERVLERMINLYVSYRHRYILCLPTGNIITPKRKDGKYSWLSNAILRNHLEQQYAVGVFADNYGGRFICFDVDDGNPDTVQAIIDELAALGFSRSDIHVSFSGGKGYHVEMFFDECIITYRLQALYSHVITARGLDPQKVEFRPMNTASIKLPLSRHAKTGNICWYVDRDTLAPIMRQDYILSIHQISAADAKALIPVCPVITPRSQETKGHSERGCSSPETRDLGTTLEQEGTRHNMMRNIAVFKRTHGASREECECALQEWIEAQDPQYYKSSQRDIRRDIDELIAWVYSERFVLQKAASTDSTVLRTSMLEGLLAQNTRTARRLYFLFLVRCRMQQPRMSLKDAGKAIGASIPTVAKGIRALTEGKYVEVVEGKRLSLSDGTFSAECRSYIVSHSGGNRDELCITITMRELIFDFNVCYHKVLHAQIAQSVLKERLTRSEWDEYLEYLNYANGEVTDMETSRRIDLIATKQTLCHKTYGKIDVFDLGDRLLYPAYDVGCKLHLAHPSAMGSECTDKESWWIRVTRCVLKNGVTSYQVVRKNFIPAEDVRRLARSSDDPQAMDICDWILLLEPIQEDDENEQ